MHIKRLLLPINGQRVDEQALDFACSLVRQEHGCVCLLSVIEVPRSYAVDAELPAAVAQSEALLRQGEAYVKARKVKVEADLLQARDSGPAIVKEAQEEGVDAILLGLPYRRKQDGLGAPERRRLHPRAFAVPRAHIPRTDASRARFGKTRGCGAVR